MLFSRPLALLVAASAFPAQAADSASDVRDLLARAETLKRVGVADLGAGRSFEEAGELLDQATEELRASGSSADESPILELEIEAVREDLELTVDLYGERFYGVFPLARLTLPGFLGAEGLGVTEQLFHGPDDAAAISAARKVAGQLEEYPHPHVILRSSAADRRLESVVADELLRGGGSTPHTRRTLVGALTPDDLEAFDAGEVTPAIVERLAMVFDGVDLVLLTVSSSDAEDETSICTIQGDLHQQGEVIQGSPVDAAPFLRVESFRFVGYARDRRDQYFPILLGQLTLMLVALIWASQLKWSLEKPLKVFYRLVIGAALFLFGRGFTIGVILVMRRFIPDARDMSAASWWWPALLGVLVIIGGGLVAWIGQARLTDIMPGARGARAVGSIFGLVALGACSHFITPLLLLDQAEGWMSFSPFLIAILGLTMLFAFAARTGPPVPHYFMVGPLLVAPLAGVALMMASPSRLWAVVGLTVLLVAVAWGRHVLAAARGTEEPEPTPEEALEKDQERLVRVEKKIARKL